MEKKVYLIGEIENNYCDKADGQSALNKSLNAKHFNIGGTLMERLLKAFPLLPRTELSLYAFSSENDSNIETIGIEVVTNLKEEKDINTLNEIVGQYFKERGIAELGVSGNHKVIEFIEKLKNDLPLIEDFFEIK